MVKRLYLAAQERTTEIEAEDLILALRRAGVRFGSYQVQMHPDVKEGPIHIREMILENLPMYLNLGDMHSLNTVIGHASASRDPQTGAGQIVINLAPTETILLEHLVEIADIKAVGFAGIMKKRDIPDGT
jgi:hypothetical protein